MKKLTNFQVENLIENIVLENKKEKIIELKEYYTNKWKNCKNKKERFEFFNEFFYNRKKLIREGYDTSMDEGILSSLLSGGLGGFKSTFKEWIVGKLLNALGVNDPDLKNALTISIANLSWSKDFGKMMSPLKNCEYFAQKIAHGVIEYYVRNKFTEWFGGGVFADTVRNAMVDGLSEESHVAYVGDSITKPICDALRKVFGGKSIMDVAKNLTTKKSEEPNLGTSPA